MYDLVFYDCKDTKNCWLCNTFPPKCLDGKGMLCNFVAELCSYNRIMTREDKVRYWLDIADYDLDTAEAMHQTGRWLYVAFMCHQVIEKTL